MVAGKGFGGRQGANCGKLSLSLPGVIKNPNILCCIEGLLQLFKSSIFEQKLSTPLGCVIFLVAGEGLEPPTSGL